ncbi:MBL fold metallo-hydrolase [Streptococcus rifensis]
MITEVLPNVFTFSIDLPKSPLKQINAYIVKSDNRALLIDTAFQLDECRDHLLAGLKELDVDLSKLEVVITHLHVDHVGLARYFQDIGCPVYTGDVDGQIVNTNATQDDFMDFQAYSVLYGMSGELDWYQTPNYKFRPNGAVDFIPLNPGDTYDIGDFHFQVIDLIGHTPGHIGLYDAQKGIVFSGDTVLDPITPNICYWGNEYPVILNSYFKTLDFVEHLGANTLLAAHRQVITDPSKRIAELKQHHLDRLQEILDVMTGNRSYTVKEIASQLTWRIRANNWEEFPSPQKWFAGGETMAHLEYLSWRDFISMSTVDGCLYFKKEKNRIPTL